jgi:hypothetical protein
MLFSHLQSNLNTNRSPFHGRAVLFLSKTRVKVTSSLKLMSVILDPWPGTNLLIRLRRDDAQIFVASSFGIPDQVGDDTKEATQSHTHPLHTPTLF